MACLCINFKKKLKKPIPVSNGQENTEFQSGEATQKQPLRQRQTAPRANIQIVMQPHKLPLPVSIPQPQEQQNGLSKLKRLREFKEKLITVIMVTAKKETL